MVLSIVHRVTGVALYAGMLLLVWWLVAAASSDAYFDLVQQVFGHWLGQLVLFGFTWALVHHTAGGIRHLIWDMGLGFELDSVERGAQITGAASILVTLALGAVADGVIG